MTDTTPILVIGAGNSGYAMAAHLALHGHAVRLWNRSPETIAPLAATRRLRIEGMLTAETTLALVTTDLAQALDGVELVLVTTPASSHRDIFTLMAPHLRGHERILLNPGRTFGVHEVLSVLRAAGVARLPQIAETQTIIYTCRKTEPDAVILLTMKDGVLLSGLDPDTNAAFIRALPACLQPYLLPAQSIVQTSLGNVGMILHCIPTLFNAGWIEASHTFKYYYDGISPTIAGLVERLDQERLAVAVALGCPVESVVDWLRRSYHLTAETLYGCIQENDAYRTIDAPDTLQHRYLFEDIPCGLVPLEAVGHLLGLPMPIAGMVISLASALLETDFRQCGRTIDRIGLTGVDGATLRALCASPAIAAGYHG